MTHEEMGELERLREEFQLRKNTLYYMLREIDRGSPSDLEAMGYRGLTKGEAMHRCFQHAQRGIDELNASFTRRFPDQGIRR